MSMDRKIKKKVWTKNKIAGVGFSGSIIFLIIYVLFISDSSAKLNIDKDRLTISVVEKGLFQEYIPVIGTAQPIETFFLDVIEGGRVVEKFVKEGVILNSGDPIVKFENANLKLQVMNNQSNFLQAESQLRTFQLQTEQNRINRQNDLLRLKMELLKAEREYKQNQALYEKNLVSENVFVNSKDNFEYYKESFRLTKEYTIKDSIANAQTLSQVQVSIKRMQSQLELVENQLYNLTVRAPIDGQLTALNAEIGQSISTGYRLGQIDNINSYKITAEVDEYYISRVHEGQKAKFSFSGKTYELEIKTVYVQVKNGRFIVDMNFIGDIPKDIRRGQTFHLDLELGQLEEALLVDTGGFYQTTGGQWVFVMDKSGEFAVKRKILLGRQNPSKYEVLEGLKPGEKVITSSYDNYEKIEKLILN